ncbi:Alpha/Beta hydrolase fold [Elaphomyces granulatus]
MKAAPLAYLVLLGVRSAAQLSTPVPEASITVSLSPSETVVGSSSVKGGGVESFRGIPYAQPPVGQLRLKPPRKITSPLGIINGTKVAPTCPQFTGIPPVFNDTFTQLITGALATLFGVPLPASEDCLTLNVFRPPGTKEGAKLPVMFWIHGGAFEIGSGTQYDGSYLVTTSVALEKPVIYVSINYRLAGFGFMGGKEILADGSANLGLQDQRMALEWVSDNIAAFGGDPTRVILWGQSAGSMSILDQMGLYSGNNTYNGKPLFHGGIMHSGSVLPADPVDCPKAQAVYDTVVAEANCTQSNDTLACLRSVDYDTFVRATNSGGPSLASSNSLASYLPRPDGKVLVDSPEVLVQSGKYAAVPLIIGDQEDEGTIFSFPQTNVSNTPSLVEYLSSWYDGPTKSELQVLVETYEESLSAGSPFRTGSAGEVYPGFKRLSAIIGDILFTLARRAMLYDALKAHPSVPIWSYESSYDHGTPVLGTFHGSELPAFFGAPQSFASQANFYYYTNFAYSLDPNESGSDNKYLYWPKWTEEKQLLHLLRDNMSLLTDNFRWKNYEWIAANRGLLHY